MINHLIYVECNPDELLVKLYGFTRRNINHSSGKSRIAKLLEKNEDCFALVDQDPDGTPIPYFDRTNFTVLTQENGYRILADSNRGHNIFEIRPYFEGWILDACEEADVNIRDYDLPNNPISLHHIINNNLKKLKRIIEELLNHNCRLQRLREDIMNLL